MTFIKILILVTLLHALLRLNNKIKINLFLTILLFISVVNEILSYFLLNQNYKISLNATIYIIFSTIIWLNIIYIIFQRQKIILLLLLSFLIISLFNLLIGQGYNSFNTYTFIIGSIIYIGLFIFEIIKKIKQEDLTFFQKNEFLLSIIPVIFFLFFSFMFAFNNKKILLFTVFDKLILYSFLGNLANIVYYGLINLYIFNDHRTK